MVMIEQLQVFVGTTAVATARASTVPPLARTVLLFAARTERVVNRNNKLLTKAHSGSKSSRLQKGSSDIASRHSNPPVFLSEANYTNYTRKEKAERQNGDCVTPLLQRFSPGEGVPRGNESRNSGFQKRAEVRLELQGEGMKFRCKVFQ